MYKITLKILLISLTSLHTSSKAMDSPEEDYVKVHIWRSTYPYVPGAVASYLPSILMPSVLTDPGHTSLEICSVQKDSIQKKYVSRTAPKKDIETYEEDKKNKGKDRDDSFVLFSLKNSSICAYIDANPNEYGSALVLKALKAGGIEKLLDNIVDSNAKYYFDRAYTYLYYGARPVLGFAGGVFFGQASSYLIGGWTAEGTFYGLGTLYAASNSGGILATYQASDPDLSEYEVTPERIVKLLMRTSAFKRQKSQKIIEKEENIIQSFHSEAMEGNLDAQLILGILHYGGHHGLNENKQEAVNYFRLAAEKQHAVAQACLAECYLEGIGVLKDAKEAEKWYKLAAAEGALKEAEKWLLVFDERLDIIPYNNQFKITGKRIMKKVISSLMTFSGNSTIDTQSFTAGINSPIEKEKNSSQTPGNTIITNLPRFDVALKQEEEKQHHLANYNYHLAFGEQSAQNFPNK